MGLQKCSLVLREVAYLVVVFAYNQDLDVNDQDPWREFDSSSCFSHAESLASNLPTDNAVRTAQPCSTS